MKPKPGDRVWYTARQLAERWGVTEDLIEHYLETGVLHGVWNTSPQTNGENDQSTSSYPPKEPYLILLREVLRFEGGFDVTPEDLPMAPDYLDPTHKYYSEELATAVKVWQELYGLGKIKGNRGHKDQIKAALAGKGLSDAAVERIATVVNPNKSGGSPASDS